MARKTVREQSRAVGDFAKGIATYTRKYWNKPPEGQFIALSEKVSYGGSQVGLFLIQAVAGYMAFAASWYCGAIMEINFMDFYTITIITAFMTYVMLFMNPIGVLIYENHGRLPFKTKIVAHVVWTSQIIIGIALYFVSTNIFENVPLIGMVGLPQIIGNILIINSLTNYITWAIRRYLCAKYGRMKPLIVIFTIPAAIIMSCIPFLPIQDIDYAWKLIILHFAFTLMNTWVANIGNVQGMVTFMSPNSQERQQMYSIVPIITSLTPSIVGIFFPMLMGLTGGFTELLTYKIFVPIFAMSGALVSVLCMLKCKERIIEVSDEKREHVKFFKGAKQVLKNKYMWIIESSKILGTWMLVFGGVLQLWFVYSIRMEWFVGIALNIVVLSMTLGNLLTPWLTKKYEKKTIIIWVRLMSLGCIAMMYGAIMIPNDVVGVIVFMLASFIKNFFGPIETGVFAGLSADAMDYHQCKYGERADGMIQVFAWIFTPIVLACGYVLPFFLERLGYTSDWDVLYNPEIIKGVFNIYIWLSFFSLALTVVPFLFYNLTRAKHEECIKELSDRVRISLGEAEVDEDGNVIDITNYVNDLDGSADDSTVDNMSEKTGIVIAPIGIEGVIESLKGSNLPNNSVETFENLISSEDNCNTSDCETDKVDKEQSDDLNSGGINNEEKI